MLIVYKKGDIRNQVVAWGADRERRIEGASFVPLSWYFLDCLSELEALLLVTGALHPPERQRPEDRKKDDSDDEDEDDYDRSTQMRSTATSVNGRTRKNVRESGVKKKGNDSDSDFEFDL